MTFVEYPAAVDTQQLVDQAVAQLRAATGATINEGHPIVALLETIAYRVAETRIIAADVSQAIYRAHGQKIYGIVPVAAAPAVTTALFTANDTAGYTVQPGTRIAYPVAGDKSIGFQTTISAVIPPGSSSVSVDVEAIIDGTHANDLPAAAVLLIDQLDWVASVATTATTAGGADGETDLAYVARLGAEIRAASTGGLVLPADYETAARRVVGVHRAIAIDGYEPIGPSTGNERTVTVAVVDADGAAVSAGVKAEVEADLEERREVNFIVHVVDPDLTAIAVDFTAVAAVGADPVVVDAAVTAALEAYLDPSTWAGGDEDVPAWRDEPVRFFELVALIEGVEGVDRLTALTIDGGTADVTLDGVAPLPTPTVTGTVT